MDFAVEWLKDDRLTGGRLMMAALGSIETTKILLILILGMLAISFIALEKIKNAVEMSRNLEWKRHFDRPYSEGTRSERRGELMTRR